MNAKRVGACLHACKIGPMSEDDTASWRLRTFTRLRRLTGSAEGVAKPEHRLLYLNDPVRSNQSHEFVFDRVFDASTDQAETFEQVGRPLVDHVLQGFNACCFAYGQTGSGKSYSMFGKEDGDFDQRGIIPRCAEHLFSALGQAKRPDAARPSVFVSFLEVYLEQVRDLGFIATAGTSSSTDSRRPTSGAGAGAALDRNNLEIYEDPSGMTLVRDLTYIQVNSPEEVLSVLKAGHGMRQTAGTDQNDNSSRSHTLFTLSVVQPQRDGQPPITGRLHLVDLAGSERISKGSSDSTRLAETKFIHTSLTALGKVVNTLAQRGRKRSEAGGGGPHLHIPYRDSKLTRLLKDSLQGACQTSLLAALNPHPDNYEECFNTLQFAVQCQSVRVAPSLSRSSSAKRGGPDSLMQQLEQQLSELKQELEFTHAHYQKLLENVAGPRWSEDLGPVERPEGAADPAGPAIPAALVAEASKTLMRQQSTAVKSPKQSLDRSITSISALETKVKRAEAQLASQQTKLSQSQSRLTTKRVEAEEFRERMVSKNANQADEMWRLRQELKDNRAALLDCEAVSQHREAEAKRRFDEECARLKVDNDALVAQLAAMTASVNSMSDTRGPKALAAQQQQEGLAGEAERKLKYQIAKTTEEKDRQIETVKQQSTYHLSRKAEEILVLKEQLEHLRAKTEAEKHELKFEAQMMVEYASRAAELLKRMEAGLYGPVERAGLLKPLNIPAREKSRHEDRIRYIGAAIGAVERLSSAANAASIPPPQPAPFGSNSMLSMGLSSRIQSAGTTHSTLPPTLGNRPHSGLGQVSDEALSLSNGATSLGGAAPGVWDVEVLRANWEAANKEAIKLQVVAEMKSDKRIEHIRSLESQLARYRQELQTEQRRGSEMAVALRSAQRLAQSNPGSPVVKALNGSVRGSKGAWGLPSPSSPARPHGLPLAPDMRPGTAGAVLMGSKGPGAWAGSLQLSGSLGSSGGGYLRDSGY